jgi:hypothetical protein
MRKLLVLGLVLMTACAEPGRDGLDGMDGEDGVDGMDGMDGVDGMDGEDGAVPATSLLCVADPASNTVNYGLEYELVEFSTGDVLVFCGVYAIGTSVTDQNFYFGWQQGAGTGACTVWFDAESPFAGGHYNFYFGAGGLLYAEYDDPGATADGAIHTFTTQECFSADSTL